MRLASHGRVQQGGCMADTAHAAFVVASGDVRVKVLRAGVGLQLHLAMHVVRNVVRAGRLLCLAMRVAVVLHLRRRRVRQPARNHGCCRKALKGQGKHQEAEQQCAQAGHVGGDLIEDGAVCVRASQPLGFFFAQKVALGRRFVGSDATRV